MLKKDKEKVLDEVWTEDRVREFLDVRPPAGVNEDFHMLLKAYQSMRADDFALFLGMFKEQGRDVNAADGKNRTVLTYINEHRNSSDYAEALKAAGANS